MPGLLSSIFDPGQSDDADASNEPQMREPVPMDDDSDGGTENASSTYHAGADGGLDLSPDITISNTMGGSYETPDGATHSWERTDEVTLTTDTQIVTAVDAMLTVEDGSFG